MLAAECSLSRGQVRGTGGQGSYCYGNRLDSARPAPRLYLLPPSPLSLFPWGYKGSRYALALPIPPPSCWTERRTGEPGT